jgi:hypothetical protein
MLLSMLRPKHVPLAQVTSAILHALPCRAVPCRAARARVLGGSAVQSSRGIAQRRHLHEVSAWPYVMSCCRFTTSHAHARSLGAGCVCADAVTQEGRLGATATGCVLAVSHSAVYMLLGRNVFGATAHPRAIDAAVANRAPYTSKCSRMMGNPETLTHLQYAARTNCARMNGRLTYRECR